MKPNKMLDRLNTLALGVPYWTEARRKALNYLRRTLKNEQKKLQQKGQK